MRVLVLTDKLTLDGRSPSCIALNLRDAAPLFLARDCKLGVCNLRRADPGAALLREAGLEVVDAGRFSVSPGNLAVIARAARGMDLLHAHGYAAANYGRLVAWRLRKPIVVHEHAILSVRPHQYLFDRMARGLTTRGVAISRAVADFMVAGRSVPPDRIRVIPNGIDLSRFHEVSRLSRGECRARYGWPKEGALIGSAARFRREKGLQVLYEACMLLRSRFPDLRCVLAGDGPERDAMHRRTLQDGMEHKILFPGFVEDIPSFMRALTVLVVPSLQEGLSFSAMEAMAAGTPVTASRTGGLPELIEDGVTGLLVPPGDPGTLADALGRLLSDTSLRKKLAGNAGRTVRAYNLETYVDRMVALYRQVLETEKK